MSTLAVVTIQSQADETPPVFKDAAGSREIVQGAWAWVKFNGVGTLAINDSFNIASVTDVGTGIFDPTFATVMPNANYAVGVSIQTSGYSDDISIDCQSHGTTAYRVRAITGAGVFWDCINFSSIVFCNP